MTRKEQKQFEAVVHACANMADPIVHQVVSRCHVADSRFAVVRYATSRLKNGRRTFLALAPASRRGFIAQCLAVHHANRALFRDVMAGRLS